VPNIPQAHKSFWTLLIEHIGYVGYVESYFGPFGDSVSFGARWVHDLHRTYHRLKNSFEHTRWTSYMTWVVWNLILVRLETALVSVQDRCTVSVKCTIGSEIILDAPDGTPR
jgi:hypothetical protein